MRPCVCGQTRGTAAGQNIAGMVHMERDALLQLCVFCRLASSLKLTLTCWQAWQSSEGASLRRYKAFGVRDMARSRIALPRGGLSCATRHIPSVLPPFCSLPTFLLTRNPGPHKLAARVWAWTSNANACGWLVPARDGSPRPTYGSGVRPVA